MTESGTFFTFSLGKLHDYLWPVHHSFTPYNDGSVFKRSPFVSFYSRLQGRLSFLIYFPKIPQRTRRLIRNQQNPLQKIPRIYVGFNDRRHWMPLKPKNDWNVWGVSQKSFWSPFSCLFVVEQTKGKKERSDFLNINCGGKKLFMANWK